MQHGIVKLITSVSGDTPAGYCATDAATGSFVGEALSSGADESRTGRLAASQMANLQRRSISVKLVFSFTLRQIENSHSSRNVLRSLPVNLPSDTRPARKLSCTPAVLLDRASTVLCALAVTASSWIHPCLQGVIPVIPPPPPANGPNRPRWAFWKVAKLKKLAVFCEALRSLYQCKR